MTATYRDFYYPLNVFMHILTIEEGDVAALHYGLFEQPDDPIEVAQERSTALILARLPAAPARILDVGIGIGATLARLTRAGYDVIGITPDDKQIGIVRERYADTVRATCTRFEDFASAEPFDLLLFQESSQYIDSELLFANASKLGRRVLVLDEFALQQTAEAGVLHSYDEFLAAAARHGFTKVEEVDLTAMAVPSIDYFDRRLPLYRQRLIDDIGLTSAQVDELIAGGRNYRALYDRGVYAYRLLDFVR